MVMKRTGFLLAMLVAATGLQAQNIGQTGIKLDKEGEGYVPAEYSSAGKTCLTFESNAEDGSGTIEVYDADISPVKTISVAKVDKSKGYTEINQREGHFTYDYEERRLEYDGTTLTLNEVRERLGSEWDSTSVVNDTTYFFSTYYYSSPDYYYSESEYGPFYPRMFYAYGPDGCLYLVVREKTHTAYTGEWTLSRDETATHYQSSPFLGLAVYNYDGGTTSLGKIFASQTLFNGDDAYEYIQPIYDYYVTMRIEEDRDYDGEVDFTRTGYEPRVTGFNIVSDNGATLQTVSFGNGLYADSDDDYCKMLKIDNKHYIVCSVYEEKENGNRQYYSMLYNITPGTTGIKQVGEPIKTRVYPTVTDRNGTVTVESGGNSDTAREVSVANAAGQTLLRTTIPAGSKAVTIAANRLSQGMNIVTVRGTKDNARSTKVMVK